MATQDAFDKVLNALDAQWDRLVIAFADLDPAAPTRVADWTVRDVEGHLTSTTLSLASAIDREPPRGRAASIERWASVAPTIARDIDAAARHTEPDLWPAVQAVRERVRGQRPNRLLTQGTGTHTVHDACRFRVVEAVVHGLDVGVEPDPIAERTAVRSLVEVLTARAPGGSVELRIPPYVAVQVVEGPRHTRGTPPNTVETSGRTWLDLATGRTTWAEAVARGDVRTRGDRADLSAWLPLLT